MTKKSGRRIPLLSGRFARAATALALASGLCLSAAACSSSGASGGGGSITVYTYGDGSTSVQQQAVDAFNKTSKVQVKLVVVPGSDYTPKLRAAMGSSAAPDVFFNWSCSSRPSFVVSISAWV